MSPQKHIHFPYGKDLPNKVYRYICLEGHHKEALKDNKLYFNSPREFNDPYEPSLLLDGRENFERALISDLEMSAISCFSHTNNNLTLWSYYANGMKGICIEFDTERLISSIASSITEKFKNHWLYSFKVKYLTSIDDSFGIIPKVIEEKLTSTDYEEKGSELIKIFATKPSIFSNENEFRLVIRPDPVINRATTMNGLYGYNKNAITAIVFGAKTREDDIHFIKELFGSNINYQSAKINKNKYSILVY